MFKWLIIVLVIGFIFSSASAFSEVDNYADAIPIFQKFGENLYQTLVVSFDYGSDLTEIWLDEIETEVEVVEN